MKIFFQFLLYPTSVSDSYDTTKLCSYSREKSWSCRSVIFTVANNEVKRVFSPPAGKLNRVRRQADKLEVIQPKLPKRNVTFSVLTVAGIDWVCEQLSETQCKPLYPKVRNSPVSRLVLRFSDILFLISAEISRQRGGGARPDGERWRGGVSWEQ